MPRLRAGRLALLLLVLLTGSAAGQNVAWDTVKIPYEPIVGNELNQLLKLKSGEVLVAGAQYEANKKYLKRYAQQLVFPVTDKRFYVPTSEDFRAPSYQDTFRNVLSDLNSRLIIPTPENRVSQMPKVLQVYVNEFGAALDEAIGTVLRKPDVPPVVRTNAARMLAIAAKSGAPALGQSIQAMLDNTYFKDGDKPVDTPPEVLLHALDAAGNLLAAYDINVQQSDYASRHSLPEPELMKFIATLQKYAVEGPQKPLKVYVQSRDGSGRALDLNQKVATPEAAKPGKPAAPPAQEGLTPEQVAVIRFYRRAAVKALAKCRFSVVGGKGGGADVRPALTLARVAVDDKTIPIPVTPPEALEAVIGLANMDPDNRLDLPSYAIALAAGLRRAAGPKAASLDDTTLPARIAGTRLTRAFTGLAQRAGENPRLRGQQKLFTDLAEVAVADIASRLANESNAAAAPDFNRLDTFINNLPPAPRRQLFGDRPDSVLVPRGR